MISRFFAGEEYGQLEFAEVLNRFVDTGYFVGVGDELETVKVSGLQGKTKTGECFIKGYWGKVEEEETFNLDAGDPTNARWDRRILRLDVLNKNISLAVLKGTPSANPVPPELTRNSSIWELSLAKLKVNAGSNEINEVIDERNDKSVCGKAKLVPDKCDVIVSTTLSDMNKTFEYTGYGNCSICSDGNNIWVAGGNSGSTYYKQLMKYTNSWEEKSEMLAERAYGRLVYCNNKLYYIGGRNQDSISNKVQCYDIINNSWSYKADKPTAVMFGACAVIGSKIYFFGGQPIDANYTKVSEVYDIITDTWTPIKDLPNGVQTMGNACYDGDDGIYVSQAGHFYKYSISEDSYTELTQGLAMYGLFNFYGYILGVNGSKVYQFNITTNTWEEVCSDTGVTILSSYYAVNFVSCFSNMTIVTLAYAGEEAVKYYTYFRYLQDAEYNMNLMFSKKTEDKLKLMNITTDYISLECGSFRKDDKIGIYVNDKTLTGSYDIEIMG